MKAKDKFRAWLAKNHAIENECYAIVKRGRPTNDDTFWYIDAVEEALCFGWLITATSPTLAKIFENLQKIQTRYWHTGNDIHASQKNYGAS